MTLLRPASSKRKREYVLVMFLLFGVLSISLFPTKHLRPRPTIPASQRASALHAKPERDRAEALAEALSLWTRGGPTREVLIIAAACTPRDAADALFRHMRPALPGAGVIDVGANKGYPVTRLAVSASPKWIISVEPDDRNYKHLVALRPHPATAYKPVRGAVSDAPGKMRMAFHRDRDDFTCFNCLNVSREEVTVRDVDVHTVDSLVAGLTGDVALLKTDTQGHEASVLTGAQRLLLSRRVQAVLMEFDPKLLGKWEKAHRAVSLITDAGLRCVSLVFAGLKGAPHFPFFGEEVTLSSLPKFWKYVVAQDKYTDLFCLRR